MEKKLAEVGGGFKMLPCPDDVCQECAVSHEPSAPHNQQSLFYQYKFHGEHGRWPTWNDALSHCDDATKKLWEMELKRMNVSLD